MHGAVAQGIGFALHEGFVYSDDGHIENSTLQDYRIPTSIDPPFIETVIVEVPNPTHPYGVRGVGEVSIAPPAAAIANAIADATGTRIRALPMRATRVLASLRR